MGGFRIGLFGFVELLNESLRQLARFEFDAQRFVFGLAISVVHR